MQHRGSSKAILSPLGLALALTAFPAVAAAQSPPAEETYYETVEVNVVNVEVFVTDREGKRVAGLTKNDFEIYEDGRPVEITNFYAMEGAAPALAEGATVEAVSAVGAPVGEIPDEQRLVLAVYVDNQHLTPQARNRVLPDLKEFLASRVRPGDRVLLASYDGPGSLKVQTAPTGDPKALSAMLDKIAVGSAGLASGGAQMGLMVREMESSANPESEDSRELEIAQMDAQSSLASLRMYAQEAQNRARAAISALGQFVDGLSGLPGRKAVLLVSGGIPLRPAQAVYQAWENRFGRLNQRFDLGGSRLDEFDVDLAPEVEKVSARANANRITFYALGAPDTLRLGSASTGSNDVWTRGQEMVESNNMAQSLLQIVGPTGGMAAIDSVKPGPMLARMREDFDTYYSLGYSPSHKRTGKNHEIEVRVKRPGLKARHREAYRDRTSAEVMSDKTLAALLFGSNENPLEVALQFGEELPGEKGQNTVMLTVKLPMNKLVLLPQGQFHEGRVTIYLAVRDEEGRNSPINEIKVPIRVPNDQLLTALGQVAGYRTKLAMRPVAHTVAVGVRDELGNVVSTVTLPYSPGLAAEAPAAGSADGAKGTTD